MKFYNKIIVSVALALLWLPVAAGSFTVTNVNNSGAGSLRQAIIDANANIDASTISFNIPGTGPFTISPASALPSITTKISINGLNQGTAGRYTTLNGAPSGGTKPAFEIASSGGQSVIRGFIIINWTNGVRISGGSDCQIIDNVINSNTSDGIFLDKATGTIIKGNKIGTDATGTTDLGNGGAGIYASNASNNIVIGGALAGEGNLVSGNNSNNISIAGGWMPSEYVLGAVIKGNIIGTNLSGTSAFSNGGHGISVTYAGDAIIGGSQSGETNLISGHNLNNTIGGINIFRQSAGTFSAIIKGNKIGTNMSGTAAIPNSNGIYGAGDDLTIGGGLAGEGNLISGNTSKGIYLNQTSRNVSIKGNKIGTDVSGNSLLSNFSGIYLLGAYKSFIGGDLTGEANIIAGTGGDYGVYILSFELTSANRNLISRNIIYGFSKGIHLNLGSGRDANNSKPAPVGYNNSVYDASTNEYVLTGTAEPGDRIELFRSDGTPQNAMAYLNTVTADQNGNWTVRVTKTTNNCFIITATDLRNTYDQFPNNNTSEFAFVCPVEPPPCDCIPPLGLTPGKKYVVTAWVREDNPVIPATYLYSNITIVFSGATATVGPFIPKGAMIDGWQRIEGEFTVPITARGFQIKLNNISKGDVYFDDIRIHPFDGNMKSFVYDPVTLKLMAELDENNYATFYEYDEEGALIRVKKETERGIMTIKETRNNNKK